MALKVKAIFMTSMSTAMNVAPTTPVATMAFMSFSLGCQGKIKDMDPRGMCRRAQGVFRAAKNARLEAASTLTGKHLSDQKTCPDIAFLRRHRGGAVNGRGAREKKR
jgi:hypothetical protein